MDRATIERQVRQVQVLAARTAHTDFHEMHEMVGRVFHAGSFLAVPRWRFRAEDRSTSSRRDAKWFFFEDIELRQKHKGRMAEREGLMAGRQKGRRCTVDEVLPAKTSPRIGSPDQTLLSASAPAEPPLERRSRRRPTRSSVADRARERARSDVRARPHEPYEEVDAHEQSSLDHLRHHRHHRRHRLDPRKDLSPRHDEL